MNRRAKKSQKPRYIVIRIKYYPIEKSVIVSGIVLFLFFAAAMLVPSLTKQFNTFLTRDDFLFKNFTKVYKPQTLRGVFEFDKTKREWIPVFTGMTNKKNDHVFNNGSRDKKQVALTFDADMTPEMKRDLLSGRTESSYNKNIVDILLATQTKATIFTSGMWVELYPEVMEELAANPLFEFGNHSYSHPGFDGECWGLTPSPDENNQKEIQKTQELLRQYTHVDNKLFRFPGGCYSQKDLESVWKEGLYVVHWDSVGSDGFNDDVENIENNILSSAQNGSVIVLHFNGPPNSPLTDDALPKIISTLKERGFEFVKVTELLEINKPLRKISVSDFLNNIGYNK